MGLTGGGGPSKEQVAADRDANSQQMQFLREQAQMGLQGQIMSAGMGFAQAQMQMYGQMQQSKQSMMGGLIAGAMAAKEGRIEHKQWLPSEVQAEFMRAFDMQQKWSKTMDMQVQGYQPVAIDYELSRKNHKSLYKDPMWNSMRMMEMSKKDMISSIKNFGVQSAGNPGGIPMSRDEWIKLNSLKDPMEMLQVDPAEAQARLQAYNDWKSSMRSQGLGLVVDIFEHPQTGGSGIMTMKGEDPLIDPSLAPLLKEMMDDPVPKFGMPDFPNLQFGGGGSGGFVNAVKSSGVGLDAKRQKINEAIGLSGGSRSQLSSSGGGGGGFSANNSNEMTKFMESMTVDIPDDPADWDAIIQSLTTGKPTKYTQQIEHLMSEGVIDKYGFVNAGKLLSFMPKGLLDPPEFNMFKELSDQQKRALMDQFDTFEQMVIDPKLISVKDIGAGVTRRTRLNEDGTLAATALEGYMPDMMGNLHPVSLSGMNRLQDWYDRMSMIDGMGPTFPGAAAPVTADELAGRPFAGFFGPQDQNPRYVANQGNKGQPGQYEPATKMTLASASAGTSGQVGTASSKQASLDKYAGSAPNPAESAGGAPLAAGE